ELFKLISEFKEHLLDNLNQSSEPEDKIDDCEKYGHDLWKLTIDYHNASKGEWSKLKVLKKDEINELSPEALKHNSMYMGELAYHQYRAACKVADRAKLLKKQVKLRGYMALCLYFTNKFLEAPLYALAAIHLQIQNSHNVTQQELNEAKKLFDKVNGRKERNKREECMTSNSNIEIKLESDFNNVMALVKIKDQEISFNHRKIIQNSINKDLNNMATKLFIEADRSLVCYQTSYNEILSAKKHATSHKVKGGATIASGVIGGGVVVSTALGNICEATFEFGIRSLAGPAFLVVGAFVIAAGIYSGLGMYKKGTKMLKEPKIREKLNKIMTKALSSYDKGEYQEFINALSEEYDEKSHKSLIECCDGIGIKGTDDIVSTLKMHGFRSDGIAYLLVLLGEVLGSGKIIIEGVTHADLKTHAKRIFREALNNDLVEEARKLDNCTSELRKTSKGDYTRFFKSTYGKVLDSILSRENTNLALEYLDDSLEMPFFSRLEEIRNIARINIAILNITEYDLYACREAIKIVDEVRKSIKENYQFISKAQLRLEILEDFLWIISGEVLPDTSFITYSVTTESALELDDKYINYLNNQLSFNPEKTHKYDKAVYFEHLAEKEAKINKLTSLRYWQCAQENYESLREVDPEELTYSLGYARCLLKLSKYTQVIGLSDTCPVLNGLSEYWHFRSIAYFKQAKYKESMVCNTEALTIDPKNNPADKHRELINKLKVENTVKHHIDRYKSELIYEADYLKNSHSNERPVYNILSIDGGGIRGVLPALWLSEIEYRTHRPISHLFNMIAGTSTGGIIAAGLSAPQFEKFGSIPNEVSNDQIYTKIYEYSDLKPRLSASELLNIYKNDAKKLFSKRSWTLFNVSDQYTNEGRSTMFKKYFEETKLSHSLTELVIPAVNETYSAMSYLFTRYDAYKNSEDDNTLVDTLMATTAAPTFFPPYNIWNKGTFLDGGIHLNNPASTAYGEAIRYKVANEKISVLSLGTGCYIPDPSKPELYRHLLFWAQNLPNLAMSAQEGNTDREMYNILGNRYQRWQIFFEEPIGLDNHESIPNLLELGCQYIEELDYSDDNPINTLVESFEH
ncbi:17417_t:CDS:1, partial [Cetraspora pellucida]